MKKTLETLTQCFGPSGAENRVRETIREMIAPFVDELKTDVMGNLITRVGTKKEVGKRVMVSAHMDEIGVMVSHVNDQGFAYVAMVGGVNPLTCFGSRVQFANGARGVLYAETEKMSGAPKTNELFIDFGVSSKADCPVGIGDVANFERPFIDLGGRVVSKALDDRSGCALAVETIRALKEKKIDGPNEIYFVFSTQEEVGLRGAKTSAYAVDPDVGVAIDVTLAADQPNGPQGNMVLGGGPCIKVRDGSLIAHPAVNAAFRDAAKRADIPIQMEVLRFAGTDAGAIAGTRSGVPSTCLSLACRYVHSPSEMIDMTDFAQGVQLLTEFLAKEIRL